MNKLGLPIVWFITLFLQGAFLLLPVRTATASDAYIKIDDNETGQGIFRQRGTECLVITPLHVVENGFKIQVSLADKRSYPAELIESFPGDIGVLRIASSGSTACASSTSLNNPRLDTLLAVERQGEIRTMLADGSIRITPVNISGYDKYRSILVTPQEGATPFLKGESGSPLYIAGQFSGVLLAVTNNVGNVIRSDALAQTVALFFNEPSKRKAPNGLPTGSAPPVDKAVKKEPGVQEFSGTIVQSAVMEHKIKLEGNSPVRLSFAPTGETPQFNVEVLDSGRRIIFQNKNKALSGNEAFKAPFTPPTTDTYTIYIRGTKGEGKYAFSVAPIVSNASLRSSANVLHVGGVGVQGLLAHGAVAEYTVQLENNSPVRLHLPATEDPLRYRLDIVDAVGKSVYRDTRKQYSATESVNIAYTPPRDGTYLLRLIGAEGEGQYKLQAIPIARNAHLRGEANVLAFGGEAVEGVIAQDAVAEYRVALEAEQPVRFNFGASGDRGTYNIEIVDSTGIAAYVNPTKRYNGVETFTLPFTPPKKDTYTLRILGIEGECGYAVTVDKGGRRP